MTASPLASRFARTGTRPPAQAGWNTRLQLLRGVLAQTSAILPVGLAFLDQSAEAFLGILEFVELVEKYIHGFFQPVAQGESHASKDSPFGHSENRAGLRSYARDELVDGRFELGFGDQTSDQAKFECTFGANGFASQNDFESALWADEEWQDRGS